MSVLNVGTHEFTPAQFVELVQQYDQFSIRDGDKSFLMIRVPSKWVKAETGAAGETYVTCRNKRKRDGHLFEINGDKIIFDVDDTTDGLDGKIKTDFGDDAFRVAMWNVPGKAKENS